MRERDGGEGVVRERREGEKKGRDDRKRREGATRESTLVRRGDKEWGGEGVEGY